MTKTLISIHLGTRRGWKWPPGRSPLLSPLGWHTFRGHHSLGRRRGCSLAVRESQSCRPWCLPFITNIFPSPLALPKWKSGSVLPTCTYHFGKINVTACHKGAEGDRVCTCKQVLWYLDAQMPPLEGKVLDQRPHRGAVGLQPWNGRWHECPVVQSDGHYLLVLHRAEHRPPRPLYCKFLERSDLLKSCKKYVFICK